jgi:hypothetical protein
MFVMSLSRYLLTIFEVEFGPQLIAAIVQALPLDVAARQNMW